MSDKLQLAIQATRAGDKKNAQYLLTQAIQEEPDDPQSWFLLSLLVDDKTKKETYLTKVVALDPDHEKAHNELAALTKTAVIYSQPEKTEIQKQEPMLEPSPVALSSDSPDLVAQDAGETLPDWMSDDLPPTPDNAAEIDETTIVAETQEAFPDWLQTPVEEDWDQPETKEEAIVDTKSIETTEQPKRTTSRQKDQQKRKDARSRQTGA
ncbi:MAG: hypothetical protein M5U34_13980 [Chloroflexi bacterium]|nr:hypothetical protein [Chloroflexota bacterium]